jgi:exosortase K
MDASGLAQDSRVSLMTITINRRIQALHLVAVLVLAAATKFYYSTASVNDLRWVLGPTTFLVELVTGSSFEFESYAGYMCSDHSFLIAASCSGINFLVTAFLLLSLGRLWRNRSRQIGWKFIPAMALIAYSATIVANTVRISTAMRLRRIDPDTIWLNPEQLHRFEGIVVYFGFLFVLFIISEHLDASPEPARKDWRVLLRRSILPLLIYYTTTLGIPLVNGAYGRGTNFGAHAAFVVVVPLLMVALGVTVRCLLGLCKVFSPDMYIRSRNFSER